MSLMFHVLTPSVESPRFRSYESNPLTFTSSTRQTRRKGRGKSVIIIRTNNITIIMNHMKPLVVLLLVLLLNPFTQHGLSQLL